MFLDFLFFWFKEKLEAFSQGVVKIFISLFIKNLFTDQKPRGSVGKFGTNFLRGANNYLNILILYIFTN